MQKAMFNDHFGLTQLVIDEIKQLTRRSVLQKHIDAYYSMAEHHALGGGGVTPLEQWLCENCARYKVGEIVAVAQSYKTIIEGNIPISGVSVVDALTMADKEYAAWSNKMFVKASCMPYQIKILSVGVEKLQDISDEDCLREGIYTSKCCLLGTRYCYNVDNLKHPTTFNFDTPREAFASLIDRVGKKGDWDKNPYVWVYEFELIK